MLRLVVTASGTGPIEASTATYMAKSVSPIIVGPEMVPPGNSGWTMLLISAVTWLNVAPPDPITMLKFVLMNVPAPPGLVVRTTPPFTFRVAPAVLVGLDQTLGRELGAGPADRSLADPGGGDVAAQIVGRPRPGYLDVVLTAARDWELPAPYIRSLQRWSATRWRGARAAEIGEVG